MRFVALAVVIAALAAGAVVFADFASGDCENYRFDSARWATDTQDEAEDIVRCEALVGQSRQELVDALDLDEDDRREGPMGRVSIFVGETNSGLGPGDAQYLSISFDADNRVEITELRP